MDSHVHVKLEDIELHYMALDAKKKETKNASVEKTRACPDRAPR